MPLMRRSRIRARRTLLAGVWERSAARPPRHRDARSLRVYHRATMADQLSLRLEADRLPELPVLRPMLPRPLPDPFDSAAHLFEPWWGGERALVSLGPAELPGTGAVRIVDAAGVDRTQALPELSGLAVRVAARSAI